MKRWRWIAYGVGWLSLVACALRGETLPAAPTAEQQQQMQTPTGTVQLYGDLIQAEQFTAIAPLLTDAYRAQVIKEGGGSLSSFYRRIGNSFAGPVVGWTIGEERVQSDMTAEVDLRIRYEHGVVEGDPYVVDLEKDGAVWKISYLRSAS